MPEPVAVSIAAVSILFLIASAFLFGIGWGCRDRMTRWWSTSIRTAGLLIGLVVLGLQVRQRGWLVEVDNAVTAWFVGHRTPVLDQLAQAVTDTFGPAAAVGASILVAATAVVRFRSYRSALVVVVTVGGASALCTAMKFVLARSRPPIGLQETLETDYSMPSGHVTGAVTLLGMLVVVVGARRSGAVNRWFASVAFVVIATVALSRLYLGVHWLSDVLAAVLLGSAAVEIGATLLRGPLDRRIATTCDRTAVPAARSRCERCTGSVVDSAD